VQRRTVYLALFDAEIRSARGRAPTKPVCLGRSCAAPGVCRPWGREGCSSTGCHADVPPQPLRSSLRCATGFPPGVAHTCVQRAVPGEGVLTQQPPGPKTGTRKEQPQ
jgi:hypothetical protein